MWTPADRALVGDFGSGQALTDDQFRLLEPLIPPAKRGGRPRTTDMRKLSIGKEPGPRSAFNWDPCSPTGASRQWDSISTAVLEAPALVTGFDDVAVMSQSIQQRGCHLGIPDAFMTPPFLIAWCVAGEHEVE